MQPLLQMQSIDKRFPGVKALSGATLSVYPGRVAWRYWGKRCGKSTLMKVLTEFIARLARVSQNRSPAPAMKAGYVRVGPAVVTAVAIVLITSILRPDSRFLRVPQY